jgi:XkdW protein
MIWDAESVFIFLFIVLVVGLWIFFLWQNTRRMHLQLHQVAQQQTLLRHDESAQVLCRAVHLLQPDAHAGIDYLIRHENPEASPYLAEWHASKPQPTTEELRQALEKVSRQDVARNYAALRRAEYPATGDQLDAAYKARQGNSDEQIEIDALIRKIKEKYPKSTECL